LQNRKNEKSDKIAYNDIHLILKF